MSDGAHLGVTARRALGTILSGQEQPTEDEQQSPREVLARVLAAPLPGEGTPPFERDLPSGEAYSMVADSITRAFLTLEGEDPGILDRVATFPDDYEIEDLRGMPLSPEMAVWQATMERWPDADEWWGGASGFQVGFAFNTARFIRGEPPVGNPAILEIGEPET